jgi:hypothetical protein
MSDFTIGFWFGVKLAESLHQPLPLNHHLAQLEAVASGELSLLPTDAELNATIEAMIGNPSPVRERIRLPERAEQNAKYQALARKILGR